MSEFSFAAGDQVVSLLDYGAGNVRSLRNAILSQGFKIRDIETAEEILQASVIVFPGQGSFKQAVKSLRDKGWFDALRAYLLADKPFFGICLGMQLLFESSDENPGESGLSIIPGHISRFESSDQITVPQMGWNGISIVKDSPALDGIEDSDMVYCVHSFCAMPTPANLEWILSLTDYGTQRYISMVAKGNILAAQFHPEKSGPVGLKLIAGFLARQGLMHRRPGEGEGAKIARSLMLPPTSMEQLKLYPGTVMANRVIACLDVRSNDAGDLVVTKGDQYDVREATDPASGAVGDCKGRGGIRNLGQPVALCKRYYDEGADEVVFLNITSFRKGVLEDLPMLQVLEQSSEQVFVPLTVGGGIRGYTDSDGREWSALDVTARYFRAGADKVSIGSDAVYAVEQYLESGQKTGISSIEQISSHYGAQAVVVSVDPKRVYVHSPSDAPAGNVVVHLSAGAPPVTGGASALQQDRQEHLRGPEGQEYCWWQVTVKGGREARDLDAITFAKACEELGAGEIMLNCIDMDGQGHGYDLPLVNAVQRAVRVPVIASSGAGAVEHFSQVLHHTTVHAALAAGIFHRREVGIQEVKVHLAAERLPVRITKLA